MISMVKIMNLFSLTKREVLLMLLTAFAFQLFPYAFPIRVPLEQTSSIRYTDPATKRTRTYFVHRFLSKTEKSHIRFEDINGDTYFFTKKGQIRKETFWDRFIREEKQ